MGLFRHLILFIFIICSVKGYGAGDVTGHGGGYGSSNNNSPNPARSSNGRSISECTKFFIVLEVIQQQQSQQLTIRKSQALASYDVEFDFSSLNIPEKIRQKAEDYYSQIHPHLADVYESSRELKSILDIAITRTRSATREFLAAPIPATQESTSKTLENITTTLLSITKKPGFLSNIFGGGFYPFTKPKSRKNDLEIDLNKLAEFEILYRENIHKDIEATESELNEHLRYARNLARVLEAEVEFLNQLKSKITTHVTDSQERNFIFGNINESSGTLRTQRALVEVAIDNLKKQIELVSKKSSLLAGIDTQIDAIRLTHLNAYTAAKKNILDKKSKELIELQQQAISKRQKDELTRIETEEAAIRKTQEEAAARLLKEQELKTQREEDAYMESYMQPLLDQVSPRIKDLIELFLNTPGNRSLDGIREYLKLNQSKLTLIDLLYLIYKIPVAHPELIKFEGSYLDSLNKEYEISTPSVIKNIPRSTSLLYNLAAYRTSEDTSLELLKVMRIALRRHMIQNPHLKAQKSDLEAYITKITDAVVLNPLSHRDSIALKQRLAEKDAKIQPLLESELYRSQLSEHVTRFLEKTELLPPKEQVQVIYEFAIKQDWLSYIDAIRLMIALPRRINIQSKSILKVINELLIQFKVTDKPYSSKDPDPYDYSAALIILNKLNRSIELTEEQHMLRLEFQDLFKKNARYQGYNDKFKTDIMKLFEALISKPQGKQTYNNQVKQKQKEEKYKADLERAESIVNLYTSNLTPAFKKFVDESYSAIGQPDLISLKKYIENLEDGAINIYDVVYAFHRMPRATNSTDRAGFAAVLNQLGKEYSLRTDHNFKLNTSFDLPILLLLLSKIDTEISDAQILQILRFSFEDIYHKSGYYTVRTQDQLSTKSIFDLFEHLLDSPLAYKNKKKREPIQTKPEPIPQKQLEPITEADIINEYINQVSPQVRDIFESGASGEVQVQSFKGLFESGFKLTLPDLVIASIHFPKNTRLTIKNILYPIIKTTNQDKLLNRHPDLTESNHTIHFSYSYLMSEFLNLRESIPNRTSLFIASKIFDLIQSYRSEMNRFFVDDISVLPAEIHTYRSNMELKRQKELQKQLEQKTPEAPTPESYGRRGGITKV